MNTFIPYPNIKRSIAVLDNKRLGKQRVEAWQIYLALNRESGGWRNHPAVLMWKGHETALLRYGLEACREWKRRGFQDSMTERFEKLVKGKRTKFPSWWGNEAVHSSHRANLLRKDKIFYGKNSWTERPVQGYVWPVQKQSI